jgi:hypothetical protein
MISVNLFSVRISLELHGILCIFCKSYLQIGGDYRAGSGRFNRIYYSKRKSIMECGIFEFKNFISGIAKGGVEKEREGNARFLIIQSEQSEIF